MWQNFCRPFLTGVRLPHGPLPPTWGNYFNIIHPRFCGCFITTKIDPDKTILHVQMPNEEFDYLAKLRGTRKWRTFFRDIQDDARKAAEANQELREKIEFLKEQLRSG